MAEIDNSQISALGLPNDPYLAVKGHRRHELTSECGGSNCPPGKSVGFEAAQRSPKLVLTGSGVIYAVIKPIIIVLSEL